MVGFWRGEYLKKYLFTHVEPKMIQFCPSGVKSGLHGVYALNNVFEAMSFFVVLLLEDGAHWCDCLLVMGLSYTHSILRKPYCSKGTQ